MKDKRIWIVIGCILVIGSGVTYYTNSYVRSQINSDEMVAQANTELWASGRTGISGNINPREGDAVAADEVMAEGMIETTASREAGASALQYGAPGSVPENSPAEADIAGAGADEAQLQEPLEEPAGAAVAAEILEDGPAQALAPVPISPLTGARGREEKAMLITDYRQRLEDLDNQIQKMRGEDAGESSSNVYSIKTSAETELKLWEGELGTIYNALLEMLSIEDAAELASEQQEWLKNRDLKAAEGTARNSSSVESLSYAATLVSLTRDRAYELAGRYEEANGITAKSEADIAAPASP